MNNLRFELQNMSTGKFVVRESKNADGDIAISLRNKGSKDVYMLTFTKDGKHTGYDFISENGTSVIISKTGGVISEELANNPDFRSLKAYVDKAMDLVNDKEGREFEDFEKASFQVRDLIPVTNTEKRSPILFNEQQLRKRMGDERFENALKTAKQVVSSIETLTVSPNGETEGYYKELRGMPQDELERLAKNIGYTIGHDHFTLRTGRGTELALSDQELRAIAFIACENCHVEHQIKNFNSFATAYMEAVHDATEQKPATDIGIKILSEIIFEQNELNKEQELFNTEPKAPVFEEVDEEYNTPVPNTEKMTTEERTKLYQETFADVMNRIREGDFYASTPVSELEKAIILYAKKEDYVKEYKMLNASLYMYGLDSKQKEIEERLAHDFAVQNATKEFSEIVPPIDETFAREMERMRLQDVFHNAMKKINEAVEKDQTDGTMFTANPETYLKYTELTKEERQAIEFADKQSMFDEDGSAHFRKAYGSAAMLINAENFAQEMLKDFEYQTEQPEHEHATAEVSKPITQKTPEAPETPKTEEYDRA